MDGLTSIAGGWDSTPGWFHTIIYSGAGIVVGGAIGLIVCAKTESCKSRFPNLFKKDSENGSANALTNVQTNQSPKPAITSSTSSNSTSNQKSTTQGGRQTRRARKYCQSASKKTRRSRK